MITGAFSIYDLQIDVWLLNGILVLFLSVVLTGILIPKILLISFRKNLFDIPDARKIHQGTVPRLGGIAFTPAIILSLSTVCGLNILSVDDSAREIVPLVFRGDALQLCFGLCALMMLYLVGLADDLIGVKYRAKFVVQIVAALLLVWSGMTIDNLHGFLGIYELTPFAAGALTVITILLIVNAINLIDGIDGLASGLSAIALGFYAVAAFQTKCYTYAMLSLAAVGTQIPFFYYNVFGDAKVGKKIFMGDTGALTTGLIISFVAIRMSRLDLDSTMPGESPMVVAFSPLLVPCMDVVRVFFHRIMRGHSPFLPGRTHIHHKLLALGIPQRYAMITIMCISMGYIALDLVLSPHISIDVILVIDFLLWVVGNMLLTRWIHLRQQKKPETRDLYD